MHKFSILIENKLVKSLDMGGPFDRINKITETSANRARSNFFFWSSADEISCEKANFKPINKSENNLTRVASLLMLNRSRLAWFSVTLSAQHYTKPSDRFHCFCFCMGFLNTYARMFCLRSLTIFRDFWKIPISSGVNKNILFRE